MISEFAHLHHSLAHVSTYVQQPLLTMILLTDLGKNLGKVENAAVVNIAVPPPSSDRRRMHTKIKTQFEGSSVTNLSDWKQGN